MAPFTGATAGDDGYANLYRDRTDEIEIVTFHRPVTVDTVEQDLSGSERLGSSCARDRVDAQRPGASRDEDFMATWTDLPSVDRDNDGFFVPVRAELRRAGIRCDMAYGGRALKTAMKAAAGSGARIALVLGDRELEAGTVEVKDLASGEQSTVPLGGIVSAVRGVFEGRPPARASG